MVERIYRESKKHRWIITCNHTRSDTNQRQKDRFQSRNETGCCRSETYTKRVWNMFDRYLFSGIFILVLSLKIRFPKELDRQESFAGHRNPRELSSRDKITPMVIYWHKPMNERIVWLINKRQNEIEPWVAANDRYAHRVESF